MKKIVRFLSMFLVFAMTCNILSPVSLAAEGKEALVKQNIRIYSSVDQKRHDVEVTKLEDKVYINANDLTGLMQGEVFLWQKTNGLQRFLDQESEFTELLKQGLNAVGVSTEAPYYYVLQNGVTKQTLRYNLSDESWIYSSNASNGLASEVRKMPNLAPPVVENDVVYVELVPFAKALGAIVNVAKEKDGLTFYVPTITMDYLASIVNEVFDPDTGVMIPWKQDTSYWENVGSDYALYTDVALDIVSGDLISFMTGNYDAEKFQEAFIKILSIGTGETENYVAEMWDDLDFICSVLTEDKKIEMLAKTNDGYYEYVDAIMGSGELERVMKADSATLSGGAGLIGMLVDIYSYQQRLAQMVTTNVDAADNVFCENGKWMPDIRISANKKTPKDIAKELVNDYYSAVGANEIEDILKENIIESVVDRVISGDGLLGKLAEKKEAMKRAMSGAESAMQYLKAAGLAVELVQVHFDYEFGGLKQLATYRELQDFLYWGYLNCIEDTSEDTAIRAQYIYDCAKLAFLTKLAFNSGMADKTSALRNKLFSINPQTIVLSYPETIEELSSATTEEVSGLIFDVIDYKFDFWDFADVLGMDPYLENGPVGISDTIIADMDMDGYPEYLMFVSDDRLYPVRYCVLLDSDAGIVAVFDDMCGASLYDASIFTDITPAVNEETGHVLLHARMSSVWETSEQYIRWTGSEFQYYASQYETMMSNVGNYKMSYYSFESEISEYVFEKMISGYSDGFYTGVFGDVGSDHWAKTNHIIEALRCAVPNIKETLFGDFGPPEYAYYFSDIRFNEDRSIVRVKGCRARTWEEQKKDMDPYGGGMDFQNWYYADAESGKVLRVIHSNVSPNGPIPLAPEDMAWLESHGFGGVGLQ